MILTAELIREFPLPSELFVSLEETCHLRFHLCSEAGVGGMCHASPIHSDASVRLTHAEVVVGNPEKVGSTRAVTWVWGVAQDLHDLLLCQHVVELVEADGGTEAAPRTPTPADKKNESSRK